MKGSQALAIPLPAFSGCWKFTADKNGNASHQHILQLKDYLLDLQEKGQLLFEIAADQFESDLENGLYFDSNIPEGYGAGSSGALCAAIYAQYAVAPLATSLPQLKKILAQIEGYFHGASSGLDPLVSYLRQPVLIQPDGNLSTVANIPAMANYRFFLLDTGIPRRTAPLVNWFLDQCTDTYFEKRCIAELAPLTDDAIHCYLNAGAPKMEDHLFDLCHQISFFQYRYFEKLIPEAWRPTWLEGLGSNHFKLKLCGAGGGGFLLGIQKIASVNTGMSLIKKAIVI